MPRNPRELLIATDYASRPIVRELAEVYKGQADLLLADLKDRLRRMRLEMPFEGGPIPGTVTHALIGTIETMNGRLRVLAPKMANYVAKELLSAVTPKERAWLAEQAAKAPNPGLFRAPGANLADFQGYARRGSLLRERVLLKWRGKIDKLPGKTWAEKIVEYNRLHPGAQLPNHWRLLDQTRRTILDGIASGKTYTEVTTNVMRDAFGVDWLGAKAGTNAITGGPGYALKKGFAQPSNMKGVVGNAKNLVRTEMASAHNHSRIDIAHANEEGGVIGVEIAVQDGVCDLCQDILGMGPGETKEFLFKDGEPPCPPDDTHVNCYCTVIGWVFADLPEEETEEETA